MTYFEMVKYHSKEYPNDIPLRIEEVAANFDEMTVDGLLGLSVHTEYSYGKRKLNNIPVIKYGELVDSNKNGVPQLWKSESWSLEFASFLFDILSDCKEPKVIEIHPPFDDYADMDGFIRNYSLFEEMILSKYPKTDILIENRCGSVYYGGKFLISKIQDLYKLCEEVEKKKLNLKIAFDVPQIYTAHNAKTEDAYLGLLNDAKGIRDYIGGVHLWGKRKNAKGRKVAHCGDLNDFFCGNKVIKENFLEVFADLFNDDVKRKMVLEVNSGNDDLLSIISDLRTVGIDFV